MPRKPAAKNRRFFHASVMWSTTISNRRIFNVIALAATAEKKFTDLGGSPPIGPQQKDV